ncbi:helix-turn-helix domain-containing protein [Mucilaginibacter ginkgonis]|uniref:Helix-turn-helix transcriptional regulator n=1 Tax=Mucilaginibacter ginkgonis TaxID=2682091 RepID=A0A6I4HWX6_9SPHI|nr:helix-turn-helix transcriptional regulator [Mucilaginibacter ginkgonis]QQL51205.1 helix-turn-helix transcriptional regulator [Mucilaginibacter ginkgonis]
MSETTLHIGRKISKIRELKGIKQETLATLMGVSQQAISKIEQSAEVEDLALSKIADALGVTPDAIKNFSEDGIVNYFNTFNDNSQNHGAVGSQNFNCTFNPLDRLLELFEENKKLYEQLLASEREKVEILKNK